MTEKINYSKEVWKEYTEDIFRERSVFLISNYGRVILKKDYDMVVNEKEGYEVKIKKSKLNGYPIFSAKDKSLKNITRYTHKIVAALFLKKPKNTTSVIHLDYDKLNNKVSNLKWVDKAGLKEHHKKNPNYKAGFNKRKVRNSKLTEKRVRQLRAIVDDPNRKDSYRVIARRFKITEMQLWRIKHRKNWSHLKD